VIAVCNRKGGAGKTTTSANLAAELATLGWRVLLVDLDSQGHCAVGLGAYTIMYDQGEYFIVRDGKMRKSVPDAIVASVTPLEAKASRLV